MATEIPSVKKPRPVNLNLLTIHFPITAIVSIAHRLSGLLLFITIPFLVWALSLSLASPASFNLVQGVLHLLWIKLLLWLVLSALFYHLLAGIRHFIMNIGLAENLTAMRITAGMVIVFSIVLSLITGVWLW